MTKAEYQRRYRKKHPEKIKQMSKRSRVLGIEHFGGNRMEVLRRDDFRCVKCDMTDAQHRRTYDRSITVDHINGLGRYSKVQDNRMENLQTLCLPCHGRKDVNKAVTVEVARRIRIDYDRGQRNVDIAKKYGVSKTVVSTIGRRVRWKDLL